MLKPTKPRTKLITTGKRTDIDEVDSFCAGRGVTELEEKLKPCPFCGGKAEYYGECDMLWVRCSNEDCQAQTIKKFDEPEDAATEWNNRHDGWIEGTPPNFDGEYEALIIAEIPSLFNSHHGSFKSFHWTDGSWGNKAWTNERHRAIRWKLVPLQD